MGSTAFRKRLEDLLGLDVRTVALFRVALALLILWDVAIRLPDVSRDLTDAGLYPRSMAEEILPEGTPWFKRLHFLSGGGGLQTALLLAAGVFALMLLAGWRSRTAAAGSWILLSSLHARNPLVCYGADMMLGTLLFWAMFLPLGAAFSVDAALRERDGPGPRRVLSMATAALVLQVAVLYLMTGALKHDSVWTEDRTAVFLALSVDMTTSDWGRALLGYPKVLETLTAATLAIEWGAPFLFFCPFRTGPVRTAAALALVAMHAGFLLFMDLGYFPFVGMAAASAILPSWFWDRLLPRVEAGWTVHYDGGCGVCRKAALLVRGFLCVPEAGVSPAQMDPEVHGIMRERNSWVVTDGRGGRWTGFEGFVALCRLSPWARRGAWLLDRAWVRRLGEGGYRAVASRRGRLGRLLAPFRIAHGPGRRPAGAGAMVADLALAAVLAYVILWNVRMVDPGSWGRLIPSSLEPVASALSLRQSWALFAPAPYRDDGWFVARARLADGREVDLHRGGAPLDWGKPEDVRAVGGMRRRVYLRQVWLQRHSAVPRRYAEHLLAEWNREHGEGERAEEVELEYLLEMTVLPPGVAGIERIPVARAGLK